MATTTKGIYYPDDYTAVADIPEDMKDLAESVDAALDDIETEQTTQNNDIEALQTENAQLKATLPTTTGTGTNIILDKTAEMEFVKAPQPGGNTAQNTYTGKNKFSGFTKGIGLNLTNGSETESNKSATSDYIEVNFTTNPNYYLSGLTNKINSIVAAYNSSKEFLGRTSGTTRTLIGLTSSSFSSGTPQGTGNIAYLRVSQYVPSGSSETIDVIDGLQTQLEIGDTATSYEPYCGGTASPNPSYPQEITNVTGDVEVLVQNKNLINPSSSYTGTSNGITTTYNSTTQALSYSGTATGTFAFITNKINTTLPAGNYTFLRTKSLGYTTIIRLYRDASNYQDITILANTTSRNAEVTNDIVAYQIYIANLTNGTQYNETDNYLLKQGSTATTYTQHKEQTYTFPLGTQRMYLGDYLADDGIHHVRGQVTFDGNQNETWWIRSDTHEIRTGMLSSYNAVSGSDILCNQLAQVSSYTEGSNGVRWVLNSQDICIHSNDINTSTMTIEQWREHLNANPLTIEFGISTEIVTPYTTQQQTVYNAIKQALSYEEQTNILGLSSESNPIFNVEAYQSIKLLLQN